MAYLLLITFASVSGILVKGCTNTGIADCFRQHMHSLQNFANKINSPEILKRLNAKDTVEEYCSSMKSLRPCLEDVKMKCLITNRITFTIDVLTAPSKFLCSEGKQDFIDHFQCAILDHIQNQTSFEICQNYMKELFESVIESQIGSSNNDGKICRAANKTVMCMEEEANKLCSDEATKVMRAKMEAAIQPLKKNISCDNNTIVRVHGCNKDGFSKCLLQSSIPNFVRKLKSINNYKILNTEKIVDEYCSIIREPSHCLEDIKTTCHSTNSVSLKIDTVLSADTFLCTVGKQGFIKNFKCVVVDLLFGRGLDSCGKNYMTELKANIILAETSGSGMSREISENICRAANETFNCLQEKSRTICGEEAEVFMKAHFEAIVQQLMSNITCVNGYSPRKYLNKVYTDKNAESSSTMTTSFLGNTYFFILYQPLLWAFLSFH